jgi:3D (Asp-Asp-Asp) domain-containing protein
MRVWDHRPGDAFPCHEYRYGYKECMRLLRQGLLLGLLMLLVAGCATIRPPVGRQPVERVMLATGYCPCQICCGWRRNWLGRAVYASGSLKGQRKAVGVTASGTRARRGTIAADTSRYPFGTTFYVEGYGYGHVEDRGGSIKGDHIDLFFPSHGEAIKWGLRRQRVLIWFP